MALVAHPFLILFFIFTYQFAETFRLLMSAVEQRSTRYVFQAMVHADKLIFVSESTSFKLYAYLFLQCLPVVGV
jgi:hypothetical protein